MISFKKNTKKENALSVEDQSLSFKDRFLRVVNILFVLLLLIQLLPNHNSVNPKTAYLIGFAVILEAVVIIVSASIKNKAGHTLFVDIVSFVYGLLILWTLATAKFNWLKESLFPPAGRIFYQFVDDGVKLLVHAGKIIDSGKVLNVKKFTMLFKIILPAALPEIFLGCNQGLGVSFILLTSAEMIGASRGIGFYVKQYSDFGDYTRTIVGLIVIGIVVVVITMLFNKLQGY